MPYDGTGFEWHPSADAVLTTLISARQAIVERGWIRGARENVYGFCIRGAIDSVAPDVNINERVCKIVQEALPLRYRFLGGIGGCTIERFNDMPWRRQGRIMRLLNKSIKQRKKVLELAAI